MNVCIIGVGSELLLGQIANTNAQYLSRVLNEAGHHVLEHIVVGDNAKRLKAVLERALQTYDGIILTGGLGPTKDDLTKQTVAEVLNQKLVTDEEALKYIKNYFKAQQRMMTPNNKQQALVIQGAHVLKNDVGMAPGMMIEKNHQKIVLLPGPPRELKPMVSKYMMPHFTEDNETIYSEVLRFAGIGESAIETELMDLINAQTNPTIAPLAGAHEVTIRLTGNGSNQQQCEKVIEPVKRQILNRVGEYYYGSNDVTLEGSVMSQTQHTIAIYDGVTDGNLNMRLKQVDDEHFLQGYMLHHPQFIDEKVDIETQLHQSAYFVQSLYNTTHAISLLFKHHTVYIGLFNGKALEVIRFNITQQQLRTPDRNSNYIMIEWLNWLKSASINKK
ncbi:CinA family nicotinamide mononucleotide deamidase-related protein [Staphylococcus ratti]|uniref:Putative competence-damage inducible protein n=1 Tax=Staphylococcus ratti TaxID=2892440 RepID=A0ABY3PAI5_9STAP|nr:CinA family nicotinamide mononucleotide deamidase-related protein [Staphylococcus ratti]UEX89294.1 CinA family nicotinamide mononucleotide deamidase-related protein [Staphylococcus ratti]